MGKKCEAVAFTAPGKVEIREVELPDRGEEDILVRTLYSGISIGTEGWILRNKFKGVKYPLVTGYQKVGIVEEVGAKVEGIEPGDRVFLRSTRLNPGIENMWGGHTQYSVISYKEEELFKLPESVDLVEASLLVLPAVAYRGAVEWVEVQPGDLVVVIGLGLIGQFACQISRLRKARVIGLDLIDKRVDFAGKYSADMAVNSQKVDVGELVKGEKESGADVIIDTTGSAKAVNPSFEWIKEKGKYCFQGYYPDMTCLDMFIPHAKEITGYFPCNVSPRGERKMIEYLSEKALQVKPLITHQGSYRKAPEMFKLMVDCPQEPLGLVLSWEA